MTTAVFLFSSQPLLGQIETSTETVDDTLAEIDLMVTKKTKDKAAADFLVSTLQNPDAPIPARERAAWAIGQLELKGNTKALIEAAQHKSLLIRSAALGSLQHLNARDGLPVYTEIAQNDPVLSMRVRATLTMGLLQWNKTIKTLVKLSFDERDEVRGASALAMAATHSKRNNFIKALKEMTKDQSPYVQEKAGQALDVAQGNYSKVLGYLGSEDGDVRLVAAVFMRDHGRQRDMKKVREVFNSEANDEVRYELERAIKAIKKRAAQAKAKQQRTVPKPNK
ncbi:MAG: HEAT repeat domain-containing protein [Elusimicrobia bacterium]|nr:HEAT repeat domain-containing protein [Candidatus Obscuribacterium magneticum]